jgi:hypothetical protein
MPIGIKIIGVPKELLFMAHQRQKKDQTLAKNGPIVRKRGGLQD